MSAEGVLAWAKERFPAKLYVPLGAFLVVAGSAVGADVAAGPSALLAVGLLLQFRLWDDLADRVKDRRERPSRVLAAARWLNPFRRTLLAVGCWNLAVLALTPARPWALAGLLTLDVFFLAWYGGLRDRVPELWRAQVLLAKYAVFALLLAGPGEPRGPWHGGLTVGLVYLCFGTHELLHDAKLRRLPGAGGALAGQMVALVGVGVLSAAAMREAGAPLWALVAQSALCAGAAAVLGLLFRRWRQKPVGGHPVFAFGFLLSLSLSTWSPR